MEIDTTPELVSNVYLKLKEKELEDFNEKEKFSKNDPITDWEKINTLDC